MSTTGSIKGKSSRRGQNPENRMSESSNTSTTSGAIASSHAEHDNYRGNIEPFEWDVDSELAFYKILINIRPIGINRHFNMMLIYDKFVKEINRDPKTVHVDDLWKKLRTLYDLDKLESNPESVNPNETLIKAEDKEFSLPTKEFSALIHEKQRQLSPSPTMISGGNSNTKSGSFSSSTKSSKKT